MIPACHRSVSLCRELGTVVQNPTAVGILEAAAQMTNNPIIEEAAHRSALERFEALSVQKVITMTEFFMPGRPTGIQLLIQVHISQQPQATHQNVPTMIARTAGAVMPKAQQM